VVEKQTVFAMTFGKMKGHRWMLKVIKTMCKKRVALIKTLLPSIRVSALKASLFP